MTIKLKFTEDIMFPYYKAVDCRQIQTGLVGQPVVLETGILRVFFSNPGLGTLYFDQGFLQYLSFPQHMLG